MGLGPLITTLGLTLTFPMSLISDLLLKDASFSLLYYMGSLLIFIAFGVITIVDYLQGKEEERKKK